MKHTIIPIWLIALSLTACGSNNGDSSKASTEGFANEEIVQETDRVQDLVTKKALRDSIYYDLLDVDFDGTDEWLICYIAGAYALVTYDIYELCGDSLVIKHATNEEHDHFFVDQNTRFDTINRRVINHFNSGCCEYIEHTYQADGKGNITLIYDEYVKWDEEKQENVSSITYYP